MMFLASKLNEEGNNSCSLALVRKSSNHIAISISLLGGLVHIQCLLKMDQLTCLGFLTIAYSAAEAPQILWDSIVIQLLVPGG
jgi:hypothetical protein